MTDEYNDNATEDLSSGAKQMRETIKRKDDTIADLEAKLQIFQQKELDSAVSEIGLDPSTGFGKALKQVYKGDVEQTALLDFAKQEDGYEPDGVPAQDTPQPEPEATVQSDARARVEALGQNSESNVPEDAQELLKKVSDSGNTVDSIRAKLNMLDAQK